jgi:cytochrome c oxidase subunit 3
MLTHQQRRLKLSENPALLHHFDTPEQQREASFLGMWVFLVTEIMFFGGLILVYVIYRSAYHDAFVAASNTLDINLGGINTAVLIGSSLTMALAVHAAQTSKRKSLMFFLVLTILLGSVFLGIKVVEYADKFHHNHVPGSSFEFSEVTDPQHAEIFFSLYFCMTGLHALHMIIGVGLLSWLLFNSWRGKYSAAYFAPVENSGLYWHFVDIVWIFLFPFLYLVSRHH